MSDERQSLAARLVIRNALPSMNVQKEQRINAFRNPQYLLVHLNSMTTSSDQSDYFDALL